MILFNTTFNLDPTVEADWVNWAKDVYFTNALDSGYVIRHNLMKLRYEEEGSGSTYSLQLFFEKDNHLEKFIQDWEQKAMDELAQRFGSNAIYFQTMLDIVI
jgi:hypothetical protein